MAELDPKDPDVPAEYGFDWRAELVPEMLRGESYTVGTIALPPRATGFYYECTVAGLTSSRSPRLAMLDGEATQDGSVTWTARAPESTSVPQVQSAMWTVPSGLALDSQAEDATHTSAVLSGGTDGSDYLVTCRMTPTIGPVRERSLTVKVRSL